MIALFKECKNTIMQDISLEHTLQPDVTRGEAECDIGPVTQAHIAPIYFP